MSSVCILGGGPAGSCAAIAALQAGASVSLIERSRFPRHKVCGEFLSPGVEQALENLGLWGTFQQLRPAVIRRMGVHIGGVRKSSSLPEPAFGLSRFALDQWLWKTALGAGAQHVSEGNAQVITSGRQSRSSRGGRLFGFKAHFRGPVDDAVELYFFGRAYVGVNCVEDGITNVCGLAPEEDLKAVAFDVDELVSRDRALRERLAPLERSWDWIFTGPLEFGQNADHTADVYVAGDALSFVDPFTGSGLLCAMLTGSLAGEFAAQLRPVPEYLDRCMRVLGRPFRFSSALRKLAETRAAGPLLRIAPASLIFRYSRPARSIT